MGVVLKPTLIVLLFNLILFRVPILVVVPV